MASKIDIHTLHTVIAHCLPFKLFIKQCCMHSFTLIKMNPTGYSVSMVENFLHVTECTSYMYVSDPQGHGRSVFEDFHHKTGSIHFGQFEIFEI